jgi:TnpA family transposase
MPIGFLTAAERDRLNRFPAQIPDDDLFAFFQLSEADHTAINQQREDHTRLGFALQLCALRYLGFAPDDLRTAPQEAVVYVARQLGIPPEALAAYGRRIPTRTMHLQQVQAYLGFRKALPLDLYALTMWLVERALEHDKPTLLLQLACDELHRERIVRPGLTRLERLVAIARQQAHEETFRRLDSLLTGERHTWLDSLLQPDPETGRTVLQWLRRDTKARHDILYISAELTRLTLSAPA